MDISTDKVKNERMKRFLQRRGWMDVSLFISGGVEYEPNECEIDEILKLLFSSHKDEHSIVPTGIGGQILPDGKTFLIFYKPLGWETDDREFYDVIHLDVNGYKIYESMKFFRMVGPDFAPDDETYDKINTINKLCSRYGKKYIHNVPADDREYFEWYLRIASSRIPRVEEKHFRNNPISEFFSFSVIKDIFRLAFFTGKEEIIIEDWERQKGMPPESYYDELFLEFFRKLGEDNMVITILNDLWQKGEAWSLFRLIDRLKKGFVLGRKGFRLIPVIEARLLSMGERISGEWNREEMIRIVELSKGNFNDTLIDSI